MAEEDQKPTDQQPDPAASQATNQNAGQEPDPGQGKDKGTDDGQEPGGQGGASARIKKLLADRKKIREEANHWKSIAARFAQLDERATTPPASPDPNQNQYGSDQVEQAYNTLVKRGVATQEDLERVMVRLNWDRLHDANETRFNRQGSKYPQYDRKEIEEYAREHNIGDPTAAYQNMYFDEIMDAVRSETRGKPANNEEKPTKPGGSEKEPLTLESFREKLQGPDRQKFYEELSKNPAKFDAILSDLTK